MPSAKRNSVLERIKFWKQKSENHEKSQKQNPFSDGRSAKATVCGPKRGDADYGCAKRGSFTEMRAIQAQEWVNAEIDKLVSVITELGTEGTEGKTSVKFGPLFVAYQDISDTLVGILQRAKKRGHISYPGEILFQGAHDHVEIILVEATPSDVENSRRRKLSRQSCVWAQSVMERLDGGGGDENEGEDKHADNDFELRKSSVSDFTGRLSYIGEGLRFSEAADEVDDDENPLRKSAAAA
jgi:hypothetical protein